MGVQQKRMSFGSYIQDPENLDEQTKRKYNKIPFELSLNAVQGFSPIKISDKPLSIMALQDLQMYVGLCEEKLLTSKVNVLTTFFQKYSNDYHNPYLSLQRFLNENQNQLNEVLLTPFQLYLNDTKFIHENLFNHNDIVQRLQNHFINDPSTILPHFMNKVQLKKGETLYLNHNVPFIIVPNSDDKIPLEYLTINDQYVTPLKKCDFSDYTHNQDKKQFTKFYAEYTRFRIGHTIIMKLENDIGTKQTSLNTNASSIWFIQKDKPLITENTKTKIYTQLNEVCSEKRPIKNIYENQFYYQPSVEPVYLNDANETDLIRFSAHIPYMKI